ncbi:MAG TPA: hypothetical protein DHV19_01395 [Bacteroides cellulosilyticus]|nr:hypothetical protein [Bacteroides cellulosilyticus]
MDGKTWLDIAVDISNILIGLCTLYLAYYVFIYQKKKDKKDTRLQWVKELVINPRFVYVTHFYNSLYGLKDKFKNSDLTDQEKIDILDLTKAEFYSFREKFVGLLQFVEPDLYANLCENIEDLIDKLTNVVDNDELKLNLENVYNANFKKHIDKSYEMTIKILFSYDGTSR